MAKRDETVHSESLVGQRLSKVQRQSGMFLLFQGKSVPITSRITIGRGDENSIDLQDPLVSRNHAVLQKAGDDFFIEDLFSTNGTFVNGRLAPPGKYVRLSHADRIMIGRTLLSLQQLGV